MRETSKIVSLDTNKSSATAMMNRLKGLVGAAPPTEGSPRPVIELVTSTRTYVLAPASIVMPQPMTTSMAISGELVHKPLYLFGWPFPVPPMDEENDEVRARARARARNACVLASAPPPASCACAPSAHALCSPSCACSSLPPQGRVSEAVAQGAVDSDAFAQWRDVMATAVAAEKATRVFPVSALLAALANAGLLSLAMAWLGPLAAPPTARRPRSPLSRATHPPAPAPFSTPARARRLQ